MNLAIILIAVFGLFALVQLYYYLAIFTKISKAPTNLLTNREGVSVIICSRNNRQGLEDNLPLILSQNHPNFEVIVVNDGSTDGTIDFLDLLAQENEKLKVLHLDIDERFHRGKKFAQTIGIKAAKHEQLIFTDSDCQPASTMWLQIMCNHFSESHHIVLGVGQYEQKRNLLNWLTQLDTFHTHLLFLNFSIAKKTYMGVGRNLAYKRSLFFSVKGFASHQHLLSGDDDLFVNETATAQNVSVCIEPEAKTISKPHEKWSHWIYQKRRHYSTGKLYKPAHKFMLGLYSISLFMFYVTFVLSLVLFPTYWLPILGIFILRFIVQAIVLLKNMQILGYKPYFFGYPLFDFGILFIQIFIGIRGYFSKPLRWNS